MADFIFSLESTLPIFLVMVCGYFFMKIKIINEEFVRVLDKFVFKVSLPISLALSVAATDLSKSFSWKFVSFCFFGTLIMFGICRVFAQVYLKNRPNMIGAFSMCAARGSAAVLGVAFANNIFGDSSMTAMMIMASVPMYNVFSVVFLTLGAEHRDRTLSVKKQTVECLKGIATNPLIISIFVGMFFAALRIKLTDFTIPYKVLDSIGDTATPMALITVGASFDWKKAWTKLGPTMVGTAIKLVVLPLLYMPIAIHMGFNGQELIAILTMTGSPTTVACYIMAKNMDNDHVLTSAMVMVSTLFSAVTLTVWVYILKTMGLL